MSSEGLKKKSIVLLSSGLDSSVNFLLALRKTEIVLALTFDYGQRAAVREIEYSRALCARYGVHHKVIELPWLRDITKTSLVNAQVSIPLEMSLDDLTQTTKTAESVWVPNRNGVFLNIAASFAETLNASVIIPGFNKEEAVTFADNSEDYLDAATVAFSYSTRSQVEVECYTTQMVKSEIAQLGQELGLDKSLVWSCYFGEPQPCEKCESCLRFARAMNFVVPTTRIQEVTSYFS